ncbi:chemotaxis protein CheA [Sporolactobacillus sp. CQH2019]|uniref:chemotaxis protein CheA n=1 Tax=Sporolactobacillus sp. CQH2019 TaxID=3023512 RepID=UPI0023677FDC|nr:chemotaxis protein CheA [Sporolactobacillus sp. CQH2019]MDD9147044.1 chemotaxis protein CheA [Sporolactobacillus sp. CQH2019]
MDMSQYLGVFIDEAREHLQNLNDKLSVMGENGGDPELLNSIFRSAHTLKGSSGQMGFADMMELTHTMENVFDALRHEKIEVSDTMIDVLFEALDMLESMVDSIEQGGSDKKDATAVTEKLRALTGGSQEAPQRTAEAKEAAAAAAEKAAGPDRSRPAGADGFDDYENEAVKQALAQGMNVYRVVVTLHRDCVLKAARALMVSNALEKIGTIMKSVPSTEDIENEAFDRQFTYFLVTGKKEQDVYTAVMAISEIDRADVSPAGAGGSGQPGKEADQPKTNGRGQKNEPPARQGRPAIAKTIRVNLDRLDHLLNLFEEMIIDRSRLEDISSSLHNPELKESVDALKRTSDQLQETILNLRMEPVEQVFNRFPRMVRSLSKELNKKVKLVISGAETELDRTVIEEIGDPLMHMIRNSMDHGIEHPDVRSEKGKSAEGILSLKAYHSGSHVIIEIEDDGAGINREKVLAKAVEKGLVAKESAALLSDQDVYHLLFESGFSTADKISDISGRGVGLDVVESKIHSLSGTVQVDSAPGKGTKFTVKLPLTLSIINALMIQTGTEIYAVPITSIVETALIRQLEIRSVNGLRVMNYRNRIVPLLSLKEYLNIPASEETSSDSKKSEATCSGSVVLVRSGDRLAGIVTEKLLGYQDIVIKPLGRYLKSVKGFSGAAILGDGKVALILDCRVLTGRQTKRSQIENA